MWVLIAITAHTGMTMEFPSLEDCQQAYANIVFSEPVKEAFCRNANGNRVDLVLSK